MNPFSLPGPSFLRLFVIVVVCGVILAWGVRWWLRSRVVQVTNEELDTSEIAYLTFKGPGVVRTAVARLIQDQILDDSEAKKLVPRGEFPSNTSDVERAICEELEKRPTSTLAQLRLAIESPLRAIQQRLEARGLVLTYAVAHSIRARSAAVLLPIALFGGIKCAVGLNNDKPIRLLLLLLVAVAAAFYSLYTRETFRSSRGDARAKELQSTNAALALTARTNGASLSGVDAALAMALFATASRPSLAMTLASAGANATSTYSAGFLGCGGGGSGGGGGGGGGGGCGG